MKKQRDLLLKRLILSLFYLAGIRGLLRTHFQWNPVRCKKSAEKVGQKFGEFAYTRKQRLSQKLDRAEKRRQSQVKKKKNSSELLIQVK